MKIQSALFYYSTSVITLFKHVRNWYAIPLLLLRKPIRFSLDNGLLFDLQSMMDVWTMKEVIYDRCYEQFASIGKNWTIIDVGAEFGDFSIMNSQAAKRIIACEINPTAVQRLKDHIALNKAPRITVEPKGAHSLKELFETYHITTCDLLKMDCEGCEYPLVFNAPSSLFKKIKRIVMEYHIFDSSMKKQFEKFISSLKQEGYTVKYHESPVHSNIGFLYAHL